MSELKDLAKELCKEHCHHLCQDTKDCVVEDEAKAIIGDNLPSALTNEEKVSEKVKQIEGMGKVMCKYHNTEKCTQCGEYPYCSIGQQAEALYNAGYRKQSEGHWIENEDDFWVMCSECGTEFLEDQIGIVNTYSYCPDCGSKMKGGEE